MATVFVSTDSLSGTTTVSNGDELVVQTGVTLYSTGTTVNLTNGNNPTSVVNFGTILGIGSNLIFLDSDTSRVQNFGTISLIDPGASGFDAVFELRSGNSDSESTTPAVTTIENFGLITSTRGLFDAFVPTGLYSLLIDNSGTIQTSRTATVIQDTSDYVDATFINSGTFIGGFFAMDGSGNARLTNSGTLELASLDMAADGGARLVNSGTLEIIPNISFQEIEGSSDRDVIINTGELFAPLDLNDGSDTVQNRGLMAGSVNTDAGADTVLNLGGTIIGNVFTGSDGDTLRNSGEIAGNANMGGADDFVFNAGLISGFVDLGENSDTYRAIGDGAVTGTIFGGGGNDTIVGGALGDVIDGGSSDDVLRGLGGEDSLIGNAGNDSVLGDGGDDTIEGGSGSDTIRGGEGADQLGGGTEADEIFGDGGNDTILAGDGNDTVRGGTGDDSIEGGLGNNNLNGGIGNDTVIGETGNDLLRGNDGNDNVSGADGADTILGGDGNDTITGGLGRDVMNGGLGFDQFRFTGTAETGIGGTRDLIQDFEVGVDLIVLSPLPGVLDFIGSGAFTGTGGEVRAVEISGGLNTLVQIDGDGDGTVDAEILLSFTTGVTEDDFLL